MLNFIRSLVVLIIAPVLTLVTSILAIILVTFFKVSEESIQVLPRQWGRIIAWCSGVKVVVNGGEKLQKGQPYIFAANHLSQFDIFAVQGFLNVSFRWLAKKELFEVPVFGKGMRKAGYIPVDRSKGRQALKSLYEAADQIAAGTSVIIFPEGTRSKDGKLHEFKSGAMVLAIKSGVPIVPVAINGTYQVLPKGKLLLQSGKVKISIGEPIETSHLKGGQKKELAQQLQAEVAKMLGESA